MEFEWPEPWEAITEQLAATLEAELRRELPRSHLLQGTNVSAIARRRDSDDVLFHVQGQNGQVAEVHLTWQLEHDTSWPATTVFESLEDWLNATPEDRT